MSDILQTDFNDTTNRSITVVHQPSSTKRKTTASQRKRKKAKGTNRTNHQQTKSIPIMRYLSFFLFLLISLQIGTAQEPITKTKAAMQTERDTKAKRVGEIKTQLDALAAEQKNLEYEILLLDDEIIPWPRWSNNFSGTLGFNSVNTENWFLRGAPSIASTNINVASTGFVLLEHLKWYWKTDYRGNLGWLKFNNKDVADDSDAFKTTNDIFQAKSIFGWRIQEKLFFATGLYYRTSLLDDKFNDPGYLTIAAAGLTWKPVPNLVIDIVPLTYNYVIAKDNVLYESSLGNNLQITYNRPLFKGLIWTTDLTAFTSYKDTKQLSNWTWFNMLSTNTKGLGLVFDIGVRANRQEALAFGAAEDTKQIWWMLGINYVFSVAKK